MHKQAYTLPSCQILKVAFNVNYYIPNGGVGDDGGGEDMI